MNLEKRGYVLKKDDVLSDDLLETWINYRINCGVRPVQLRPAPYEFHLYYDI